MRDVIIALDLATNLGFAVGMPGARPTFGTKRIGSPGCSVGEFGSAFDLWLSDMITVHAPTVLCFEAPVLTLGHTSIDTARKLMGMVYHAEVIAYRLEIRRVFEESTSTVTKFFVGRGGGFKSRAEKKGATIAACKARGWNVGDDNQADACALFAFAEHQLFRNSRPANAGPIFMEAGNA